MDSTTALVRPASVEVYTEASACIERLEQLEREERQQHEALSVLEESMDIAEARLRQEADGANEVARKAWVAQRMQELYGPQLKQCREMRSALELKRIEIKRYERLLKLKIAWLAHG